MDTFLDMVKGSKTSEKEATYSPSEVMRILNSDNQEIQRLCKEVNIFPKKDNITGKIFFFKNDVEILKKLKALNEKSDRINKAKQQPSNNISLSNSKEITKEKSQPKKAKEPNINNKLIENNIVEPKELPQKVEHEVIKPATNPIAAQKPDFIKLAESVNTAIVSVNDSVNTSQGTIIEKLSSYLDEKLDGLDEVIVDLIKCKVENEKLKLKNEQLIKENFNLTSQLSSFTPIAMGLYLKKN